MEVKYFQGVRKRGKVEILMLAGRTRCEQSLLRRNWSSGMVRNEAGHRLQDGGTSDSFLGAGGP